jgi:hypothetical protein
MSTQSGVDGFPALSKPTLSDQHSANRAHFAWLCRSWAIAGVFHFLTFHDWRWQGISGCILICLAMAVLRRPTPLLFGGFLSADIVAVGMRMGPVPNHILFSLLMNAVMLIGLIVVWVRERHHANVEDVCSQWLQTVAPVIRIAVVILYFFTVFHKINQAYFNPNVSCASSMLREIGIIYPIIPSGGLMDTLAIYGTLVIEALIPILMLIPRTRLLGGVLALGFHGMLSLHPFPGIYSFTATVVSLLSWFLPSGFFVVLRPSPLAKNVFWALWGTCVGLVMLALLVGNIPALKYLLPIGSKLGFSIGYYAILVYSIALVVTYVQVGWRHLSALESAAPAGGSFSQRLLLACPVCALLMLIGMQPYLGLRTRMCFSMFSNLQTEGGVGNHLVMPQALQQTRWQRELVSISASSDPGIAAIAARHHRIPILELSRRVRESRAGYSTTFIYMDKTYTCRSGDASTYAVLPEINDFGRRYLYFRSVGPDPSTVPCQW